MARLPLLLALCCASCSQWLQAGGSVAETDAFAENGRHLRAGHRRASGLVTTTFYVSAAGRDTADGTTPDTAFASLEAAQDAVATLRLESPGAPPGCRT